MKIYVASSWRNQLQPAVVQRLRDEGHEVYDFKNPWGGYSFSWSEIDPSWKSWDAASFRLGLGHPIAVKGFYSDMAALSDCDACVLVMPCGRSAHLEMGWACGVGKHTAILLSDGDPELMIKMVDKIAVDLDEVVQWLAELSEAKR